MFARIRCVSKERGHTTDREKRYRKKQGWMRKRPVVVNILAHAQLGWIDHAESFRKKQPTLTRPRFLYTSHENRPFSILTTDQSFGYTKKQNVRSKTAVGGGSVWGKQNKCVVGWAGGKRGARETVSHTVVAVASCWMLQLEVSPGRERRPKVHCLISVTQSKWSPHIHPQTFVLPLYARCKQVFF